MMASNALQAPAGRVSAESMAQGKPVSKQWSRRDLRRGIVQSTVVPFLVRFVDPYPTHTLSCSLNTTDWTAVPPCVCSASEIRADSRGGEALYGAL